MNLKNLEESWEYSEAALPIQNSKAIEKEKYNSLFNILRGFEEFILNTEGIIISSNLEAVNITGYEEWEIMGKHFSIFYRHVDLELGEPEKDLQKAAHSKKIVLKGWKVKKRSTEFWATMKIETLHSKQESIAGYRMILQDTTHKAMYNFRVDKIKNDFLNLFENSYTGIFRYRFSTGKISLMNTKALEIFRKNEMDNFYFQELFEEIEEFNSFNDKLIQRKRISGFEFKIRCSRGLQNWAAVTCRYYSQEDWVEGILLDVTEKKKQLLQLQHLTNELDQFIYHSSHDLRAPLTSLLGLANLILIEKKSNPSIDSYATMIKERVHYLDNLLKTIVLISSNNRTKVSSDPIQAKKEIQDIIKEFGSQIKNIKIKLAIDQSVEFHSDLSRIRTIISSLISNSIKFINPNISNQSILISFSCTEDRALIKIADNGIGIETQYHNKIFDMFFKGTASFGFGLGLYIVKCIVNKLEGKIHFVSEVEKGTEFTIELPNTSWT